ncbi:ArsR family transcriptional regulator [Thermococci archaeon]|nr:MAG: ArsR family transcriptional regulator [Thermococci archaeon]
MNRILEILKERGEMSTKEIAKEVGLGMGETMRILTRLLEEGKVRAVRRESSWFWKIRVPDEAEKKIEKMIRKGIQ